MGQVLFELAKGLVFLVADAGEREIQGLADLRDSPAVGPELDDPILAGRQDGLSRGFEDLAEFLAVAMAPVDVGTRDRLVIQRLIAPGALDPLADHVDGPDQFATL